MVQKAAGIRFLSGAFQLCDGRPIIDGHQSFFVSVGLEEVHLLVAATDNGFGVQVKPVLQDCGVHRPEV